MKYMLIHPIDPADVIECADLDEAIEVASKHPTAWLGTIEVRPILGTRCGSPAEAG